MVLVSQITFQKYDRDNSGTIDRSELRALAYDMGHPLTSEQLTAAFNSIDTSGDGRISWQEFQAWWSQSDRFGAFEMTDAQASEDYARREAEWLGHVTSHFAYFDKDHSGTISRDEFPALYKNLREAGYRLPQTEAAARAVLDIDGDGTISLREYVHWMRTATRH